MSMLPPSAPPDPAPAAPVALAAEGEASAAGAVIRAKVRLAGLRLVVLEDEDDWTDSGGGSQCGPPFRVGPRTVVLATGADGGEILKEEQEKNEHSIELEWFRASMPGGALTPIPGVGVGSARYRPSADDVGSCISVQASLLTPITLQQQQQQHEGRSSCIDDTGGVQQPPTPHFAVFAEVGPFALSAHLQERLAGQEEPVVFKGLQEAEEGEYGGNGGPRHVYDLVVGPKYVELWSRPLAPVVKKRAAATRAAAPLLKEREPWSSSLSSDDEEDDEDGSSSGGSSDGEGEEGQEGELLGRGPYSLKTLVALHPHAPKVVLVQLPLFLLLDSSRPSLLPAEERSEQQVEEPSVLLQRALQLGSKEERDLLALLWRVRRREALQAQQGDQEEQEQEGAALDAVLLMSSLATAGRSPVVARVSSEGDGPEPEQARNALLETARLSSSSLGSSGDDGDGAVAEEGSAVLQEEEGSTVGEKKQTLERQQQEQQQQQQGHVRRARSSASGLGGLLMLGRGGAKDTNGEEQRSKEETVRGLKREAEALQRHVGQLEGQLEAANDEAVRE